MSPRPRPRRPTRRAGRAPDHLVACVVAVVVLLGGCGDPNSGDAAEVEFRAFLRDQPVDGYDAALVAGRNDLPFSGTLQVTMKAVDPEVLDEDGYVAEMAGVADQVCRFDPEADATLELGYQVGDVAVPLACPGEPSAGERIAAQAALLVDLQALRGVQSIDATGGYVEARAATADGTERVSRAIEEVVRRHPLAFGAFGDREPSVSVGTPTGTPTGTTATTAGQR